MKKLLRTVFSTIQRRGIVYTLSKAHQYVYNKYVRYHLPRRRSKLNGVCVRYVHLLDDLVPWNVGHPVPDHYEQAIISSLQKNVFRGDNVVIVGGGWGVSSVIAAQMTGPEGSVMTFEASPRYARYVEETVALNEVDDRVEIEDAVVSRTISTLGTNKSGEVIDPSNLPDCDVLELDCEGVELDILDKIEIQPRTIIVESHGIYGSPTEEVVEKLKSRSYRVVSKELAECGPLEEMCIENDVRVVTGIKEP